MYGLLCRFVGHQRSASRAYLTADGWRSRCKTCGVPLKRIARGSWTVSEDEADAARLGFADSVVFRPTNSTIMVRRER